MKSDLPKPLKDFYQKRENSISSLVNDANLQEQGIKIMRDSGPFNYAYNFDWLGVPAIQLPTDMVAIQELIWKLKPQVIIETGVAHGGSIIFYSSLLHLIDEGGIVVGIDIDIRDHNRDVIESHKLSKNIHLVEGSSTDKETLEEVEQIAQNKSALVILDSDHSKDHVAKELDAYKKFLNKGGYLIVMDTTLEDQPDDFLKDRPWNKLNNPKVAVWEFLDKNKNWVSDDNIDGKLLLTVCKNGFLKKISD